MESEAEIIRQVQDGNRERFSELIRRYQNSVYGIAWSRLGDTALSEDAAQETFIKAYRNIRSIRDPKRFPGWICKIARNVSATLGLKHFRDLNHQERWKLHQEIEHPPVEETEPYENKSEVESLLQTSLGNLAPKHRECLTLFYLEDKKISEAAVLAGISEQNFKTRLHRARKALRSELENRMEESLNQLRPSGSLLKSTMLALPAEPIALGTLGGLVLKLTTSFGKMFGSVAGFIALLPLFPAVIVGFISWLDSKNWRDPKNYQAQIRKRATLWVIGMIVGMLLLLRYLDSLFLLNSDSTSLLTSGITALCLLPLLWTVKIHRNIFQVALVCNFVCVFLMVFLPAISIEQETPRWFGLLFGSNFLFMAYALQLRPARSDYSLFLRAARNELGDDKVSDTDEADEVTAKFSHKNLVRFARFLGSHYLASNYQKTRNGLTVVLSRVPNPGVFRFLIFWPTPRSSSFAEIPFEGKVTAFCNDQDFETLNTISNFNSFTVDELNQKVVSSLCRSLRAFQRDERESAFSILQPVSDEMLLKKTGTQSWAYRFQALLLISTALGSIFLSFVLLNPIYGLRLANEIEFDKAPMETYLEEQINSFLSETFGISSFSKLFYSEFLMPDISLMSESSKQRLREIFTEQLSEQASKGMLNFVSEPDWVFQAIHSGLMTREEVLEIVDPYARFPAMASDIGEERIWRQVIPPQVPVPFNVPQSELWKGSPSQKEFDGYVYQPIVARTYTLKALGILDKISTKPLTDFISGQQILDRSEIGTRFPYSDFRKVKGLFYFQQLHVDETWAALTTLEIVNGLDTIDKKACVEALLDLHLTEGVILSPTGRRKQLAVSSVTGATTGYVVDSLRILAALDSVQDLDHWKFRGHNPFQTSYEKSLYAKHSRDRLAELYNFKSEWEELVADWKRSKRR